MLLEQASELVSLEEFDEAFHIYNKILRDDPKNINALIDKGLLNNELQKTANRLNI